MVSRSLNKLLKSADKHRIISGTVFLLVISILIIALDYAKTLHVLSNDIPKIAHQQLKFFDGLSEGSNIGRGSYDYMSCQNEDRKGFGVDIVCAKSYSYEFEPTGVRAVDEQRMRGIYDRLVADGWTGGSKSNLYDVVPAKNSSQLQLTDNGILFISLWKTIGGSVNCDINMDYIPVLPHLEDTNGSYKYDLYCRKSMFP